MGICGLSGELQWNEDVKRLQKSFEENLKIPLEVQVSHFTPSSFPLIPVVSSRLSKICEKSWETITKREIDDEYGGKISGMTAFYTDFYDRLDIVDSGGRFEAVLGRNISGENQIAAKGAILIRIIQFILRIESDSPEIQFTLFMLGKSHSQKGIRPWQYSTFVQTLLQTIAAQLGTEASNNVMEAWVNLFAFVLKSMLPPAIQGQVVETELNVYTSSEFAAGKLADEVADIEEIRDVRKKFKSGTSRGGTSRVGGSVDGGDSVHSHNIYNQASSRAVAAANDEVDTESSPIELKRPLSSGGKPSELKRQPSANGIEFRRQSSLERISETPEHDKEKSLRGEIRKQSVPIIPSSANKYRTK